MEKTVMIEIDELGNSSLDLQGFQGKGCSDVAKAFQGDDTVTKSQRKREFYIEATVKQAVRQKRG